MLKKNCPRNLNKESIDLYLVLWYFFPFSQEGINNIIEDAFLSANKLGVKVIGLADLNKVDPAFCHLSLYLILKVNGHLRLVGCIKYIVFCPILIVVESRVIITL